MLEEKRRAGVVSAIASADQARMGKLHKFRLSLQGSGTAVTFNSSRLNFRSQLASALIDLRLRDALNPIVLHIAGPAQEVDLPQWLAPVDLQGGTRCLEPQIRWECAGDAYDELVRMYWAERNRVAALPPQLVPVIA